MSSSSSLSFSVSPFSPSRSNRNFSWLYFAHARVRKEKRAPALPSDFGFLCRLGVGHFSPIPPTRHPVEKPPWGNVFFLNWQQLLSRLEIIIADNLWCVIFIYWLHLNTVLIFHWLLKQKKAIFELWMTRLR